MSEHRDTVAQAWASRGPFGACDLLSVRYERNGRSAVIACLWHADKSPSCTVAIGPGGTLRFHCFACSQSWDVFSAVAERDGLDATADFPKVLSRAAELVGCWDAVDAIEGRETRPLPPTPPAPEPERIYPDAEEVADLLGNCRMCDADRGVWDWLKGRGLSAHAVSVRDLAYALPEGIALPPWAKYRGKTWLELGHRLLVPLFDAEGNMRSVRAGRIVDGESPKRLPPAGHRASGLVMLDAMGREAFRIGVWPPWASGEPRFVVCEGEPDFLTVAVRTKLNEVPPHAVIGIYSGSWCDEIATRIPAGAKVAVWTDPDAAGDKYAEIIRKSLEPRCSVIRGKVRE